MDDPAISVIVVAYRQRELLAEAIGSVLAAGAAVPGGVELIVVDNGDLSGFVRAQAPGARIIEPGQNLGFAGAVQRGLAVARGRWVALVNDDAVIEPESLARLLAAGERDEQVGAVAAQVRFRSDPGRVNSAGISVNSLGVATERLAGRPVREAQDAVEVFGACGCFALYRKEMLDTLGGLEASFFAYLEDVDLAWRARAAGWHATYEPSAIALHRGSASSGEGSARKYFLVGRNRVRLLARNATSSHLVRALPGILVYDLAYVLYVALSERTLAPLRGRLVGLREWRDIRSRAPARVPVKFDRGTAGWLGSLRQHLAYGRLGASRESSA